MKTHSNARSDCRWRHRWQVVRLFHNGALVVCCSHRSGKVTSACAGVRNLPSLWRFRGFFHKVRLTPGESS